MHNMGVINHWEGGGPHTGVLYHYSTELETRQGFLHV